jgi:hypothetical protein
VKLEYGEDFPRRRGHGGAKMKEKAAIARRQKCL